MDDSNLLSTIMSLLGGMGDLYTNIFGETDQKKKDRPTIDPAELLFNAGVGGNIGVRNFLAGSDFYNQPLTSGDSERYYPPPSGFTGPPAPSLEEAVAKAIIQQKRAGAGGGGTPSPVGAGPSYTDEGLYGSFGHHQLGNFMDSLPPEASAPQVTPEVRDSEDGAGILDPIGIDKLIQQYANRNYQDPADYEEANRLRRKMVWEGLGAYGMMGGGEEASRVLAQQMLNAGKESRDRIDVLRKERMAKEDRAIAIADKNTEMRARLMDLQQKIEDRGDRKKFEILVAHSVLGDAGQIESRLGTLPPEMRASGLRLLELAKKSALIDPKSALEYHDKAFAIAYEKELKDRDFAEMVRQGRLRVALELAPKVGILAADSAGNINEGELQAGLASIRKSEDLDNQLRSAQASSLLANAEYHTSAAAGGTRSQQATTQKMKAAIDKVAADLASSEQNLKAWSTKPVEGMSSKEREALSKISEYLGVPSDDPKAVYAEFLKKKAGIKSVAENYVTRMVSYEDLPAARQVIKDGDPWLSQIPDSIPPEMWLDWIKTNAPWGKGHPLEARELARVQAKLRSMGIIK